MSTSDSCLRARVSAVSTLLLLISLCCRAQAPPLAELISTRTSDGVLLHGLHYRPSSASRSVVVHIPGGAGAFFSVQDMSPMASALTTSGVHFLSMNTRTAGGLGMSGMMYARFEDYEHDVAAAVAYAKSQGLQDIILLGHSLGSARVMYYLAQGGDPAVKGVILSGAIASPYLEAQMRWDARQRAAFDAFLAQQRERIAGGRGRELAAYEWAPGRMIELSAASWVSIFGNLSDSNASTVKFAQRVKLPVLLVHGTADRTAIPRNAEEIYAALANSPAREIIWIDGADHLFSGHVAEFAEAVTHWAAKVLVQTLPESGA